MGVLYATSKTLRSVMAIHIQGASEHNLKDIDVEFGDGLTVVTGVSGSGKTSLVFDTLYHEARRRFLEVFSLGSSRLRLSPANVRAIKGLGPAMAVGQNLLNRNPLSTLATASGLHPFLRLLYANFGQRHCPRCATGLSVLTEDEIIERLVSRVGAQAPARPLTVYAPLLRNVQGSHTMLLELLTSEFRPGDLLVDGHPYTPHKLNPAVPHTVEVELDRASGPVSPQHARQIVEMAASLGAHTLTIRSDEGDTTLSRTPACVNCGTWFGNLEPVHFRMPCPHCDGDGCERCGRTGLYPEAAAVRWHTLRLPELLARSVNDVWSLFADAALPSSADRLQTEIERRLEALSRVGLGYISLDRSSPTLSCGEAQRVRLAVAMTSRLEDMLHVLDEPTIGQHPADVARLLPAFRELAGPVVYVEHDRIAAAAADHAIDLGPGAGSAGGSVLFSGTPSELWKEDTPTGRYFSKREIVRVPEPRPDPDQFLMVRGADLRNLQEIDVPIPLGRLSVITGVSGSGKSTLVDDVLVASLAKRQPIGCRAIEGPQLKPVLVDQSPIGRNPRSNPATYTKLADIIRDCFAAGNGLSSSHFSFNRPEGACPKCKGMGATEVQMRYLPSTWIRCSACVGKRFSDEVLAARTTFGKQDLSIADFYELSIAEATPLLVEHKNLPEQRRQAARRIMEALRDIGLGYLSLGQPSPTLSGGEAQRVKLAKYLGRRSLAKHLLVLDEPSTGLHPQDVTGLLTVLDHLVRAGATIVVVEHNTDIIRAADWVIDLGPGAGPEGGRALYAGLAGGLAKVEGSATGQALQEEDSASGPCWQRLQTTPTERTLSADKISSNPEDPTSPSPGTGVISIRDARAHNLKGVNVDFPKRALTVVTGVSGSGKSSLVHDVLEAEARRRFLETLSLYERQGTREGPEAPVESVTGLGVSITVGPDRRLHDRRATVGTATEISHQLAVLLSCIGERRCLDCGAAMTRGTVWTCPVCDSTAPIAQPRHFSPSVYAAACLTCHGVGSQQVPNPEKLIVHPERPLCGGAMYSPGFFPKGYLCKPFNGGYYMVQAIAGRYGFDPATTPWDQMTPKAQRAFLFGDPEPIEATYHSRTGRTLTRRGVFPGFYGWIGDWDVGGTYTDSQACPDCSGARLRPEYLAVTLGEYNNHDLSEMPLSELIQALRNGSTGHMQNGAASGDSLDQTDGQPVAAWKTNLRTAIDRLGFLRQVGLGYLHLNRPTSTLSAGEAQRIKLAGLLGSGLISLTVLLDEPSRGLHPSEVEALLAVLIELRDEGNTVIVVEHDPVLIRAADHLIDLGPGAGVAGGKVVAYGTPELVATTQTLTGIWLRGERTSGIKRTRREPRGWMIIQGARSNNLRGEDVHLPLGVLVGVCGVSGSGKSTLLIDTLGRALAPRKQTTSVAYEPIEPGDHDGIEGAPTRTVLVDQARKGVISPANFLNLARPLRALYAASDDAQALGLDEKQLGRRCSACGGRGTIKTDMGFLPDIHTECETCQGTGHLPEAWEIRLHGLALPEVYALTIDQVYDLFREIDSIARPLAVAQDVGLGYLVLRQPGYALSGGEAQRLKIVKELCRRTSAETLYILDEPTVGQHLEDVARLTGVLHRLVDGDRTAGTRKSTVTRNRNTVVVVEHHPHLLASCDWLVELGPGGGPDGGKVIASGSPETFASGDTPTAPYLRDVLWM